MTVKYRLREEDARKIWHYTEESHKPFSIYISYEFVAKYSIWERIILALEILTAGKFISLENSLKKLRLFK